MSQGWDQKNHHNHFPDNGFNKLLYSRPLSSQTKAISFFNSYKFKMIKRVICLVVSTVFFLEQMAYSADTYSIKYISQKSLSASRANLQESNQPDPVEICREAPSVLSDRLQLSDYNFAEDTDARLIIQIQDLHTHAQAQYQIASALRTLASRYNVKLICLEGASGAFNKNLFSFLNQDLTHKVSRFFLEKGRLTGAEYFYLNTDIPVELWGIENKDDYFAQIKAFNLNRETSSGVGNFSKAVNEALNSLKEAIYCKKLLEADKAYSEFLNGEIKVSDYCLRLEDYAKKLSVNIDKYENFKNLIRIIESKEMISKKDSRFFKFITKVKNLLGKEKLNADELVAKAVKDLNTASENLKGYKIYDEIEALELQVRQQLYENDDQRELDKKIKAGRTLKMLADLSLASSDWNYYRSICNALDRQFFVDFINKHSKNHAQIPAIDLKASLKKLEEFYCVANLRDDSFFENTLRKMNDDKTPVAIVITGGFHSKAMIKDLSNKGFSYMVFTPVIDQAFEKNTYYDVLNRKPLTLNEIMSNLPLKGRDELDIFLDDNELAEDTADALKQRLVPALLLAMEPLIKDGAERLMIVREVLSCAFYELLQEGLLKGLSGKDLILFIEQGIKGYSALPEDFKADPLSFLEVSINDNRFNIGDFTYRFELKDGKLMAQLQAFQDVPAYLDPQGKKVRLLQDEQRLQELGIAYKLDNSGNRVLTSGNALEPQKKQGYSVAQVMSQLFDYDQAFKPLSNEELLKHSLFWPWTNEDNWFEALESITGRAQGGMYLGVSCGGQNLSYILQSQPELAVIMDKNPVVTRMYLPFIFWLILNSNNRAEFISKILGTQISKNEAARLVKLNLNQLLQRLSGSGRELEIVKNLEVQFKDFMLGQGLLDEASLDFWLNLMRNRNLGLKRIFSQLLLADKNGLSSWLTREEGYNQIKDYLINGKIRLVTGSWFDAEDIEMVNQIARNNNLQAKVIYASNIEERARSLDSRNSFYNGLSSILKSDEALIVNAFLLRERKNDPLVRPFNNFAQDVIAPFQKKIALEVEKPTSPSAEDGILGAMHEGGSDPARRLNALRRLLRMKGIDIEEWAQQQQERMDSWDKRDLEKALSVLGLTEAQIKSIMGKIILAQVPREIRLEGKTSRIGSLIIRTKSGHKILFPKDRLQLALKNREHLADLLHEVVELDLVEQGVPPAQAHEQAMIARKEFLGDRDNLGNEFDEIMEEAVVKRAFFNNHMPLWAEESLQSIEILEIALIDDGISGTKIYRVVSRPSGSTIYKDSFLVFVDEQGRITQLAYDTGPKNSFGTVSLPQKGYIPGESYSILSKEAIALFSKAFKPLLQQAQAGKFEIIDNRGKYGHGRVTEEKEGKIFLPLLNYHFNLQDLRDVFINNVIVRNLIRLLGPNLMLAFSGAIKLVIHKYYVRAGAISANGKTWYDLHSIGTRIKFPLYHTHNVAHEFAHEWFNKLDEKAKAELREYFFNDRQELAAMIKRGPVYQNKKGDKLLSEMIAFVVGEITAGRLKILIQDASLNSWELPIVSSDIAILIKHQFLPKEFLVLAEKGASELTLKELLQVYPQALESVKNEERFDGKSDDQKIVGAMHEEIPLGAPALDMGGPISENDNYEKVINKVLNDQTLAEEDYLHLFRAVVEGMLDEHPEKLIELSVDNRIRNILTDADIIKLTGGLKNDFKEKVQIARCRVFYEKMSSLDTYEISQENEIDLGINTQRGVSNIEFILRLIREDSLKNPVLKELESQQVSRLLILIFAQNAQIMDLKLIKPLSDLLSDTTSISQQQHAAEFIQASLNLFNRSPREIGIVLRTLKKRLSDVSMDMLSNQERKIQIIMDSVPAERKLNRPEADKFLAAIRNWIKENEIDKISQRAVALVAEIKQLSQDEKNEVSNKLINEKLHDMLDISDSVMELIDNLPKESNMLTDEQKFLSQLGFALKGVRDAETEEVFYDLPNRFASKIRMHIEMYSAKSSGNLENLLVKLSETSKDFHLLVNNLLNLETVVLSFGSHPNHRNGIQVEYLNIPVSIKASNASLNSQDVAEEGEVWGTSILGALGMGALFVLPLLGAAALAMFAGSIPVIVAGMAGVILTVLLPSGYLSEGVEIGLARFVNLISKTGLIRGPDHSKLDPLWQQAIEQGVALRDLAIKVPAAVPKISGKIYVNPDILSRLSKSRQRQILRHELAHIEGKGELKAYVKQRLNIAEVEKAKEQEKVRARRGFIKAAMVPITAAAGLALSKQAGAQQVIEMHSKIYKDKLKAEKDLKAIEATGLTKFGFRIALEELKAEGDIAEVPETHKRWIVKIILPEDPKGKYLEWLLEALKSLGYASLDPESMKIRVVETDSPFGDADMLSVVYRTIAEQLDVPVWMLHVKDSIESNLSQFVGEGLTTSRTGYIGQSQIGRKTSIPEIHKVLRRNKEFVELYLKYINEFQQKAVKLLEKAGIPKAKLRALKAIDLSEIDFVNTELLDRFVSIINELYENEIYREAIFEASDQILFRAGHPEGDYYSAKRMWVLLSGNIPVRAESYEKVAGTGKYQNQKYGDDLRRAIFRNEISYGENKLRLARAIQNFRFLEKLSQKELIGLAENSWIHNVLIGAIYLKYDLGYLESLAFVPYKNITENELREHTNLRVQDDGKAFAKRKLSRNLQGTFVLIETADHGIDGNRAFYQPVDISSEEEFENLCERKGYPFKERGFLPPIVVAMGAYNAGRTAAQAHMLAFGWVGCFDKLHSETVNYVKRLCVGADYWLGTSDPSDPDYHFGLEDEIKRTLMRRNVFRVKGLSDYKNDAIIRHKFNFVGETLAELERPEYDPDEFEEPKTLEDIARSLIPASKAAGALGGGAAILAGLVILRQRVSISFETKKQIKEAKRRRQPVPSGLWLFNKNIRDEQRYRRILNRAAHARLYPGRQALKRSLEYADSLDAVKASEADKLALKLYSSALNYLKKKGVSFDLSTDESSLAFKLERRFFDEKVINNNELIKLYNIKIKALLALKGKYEQKAEKTKVKLAGAIERQRQDIKRGNLAINIFRLVSLNYLKYRFNRIKKVSQEKKVLASGWLRGLAYWYLNKNYKKLQSSVDLLKEEIYISTILNKYRGTGIKEFISKEDLDKFVFKLRKSRDFKRIFRENSYANIYQDKLRFTADCLDADEAQAAGLLLGAVPEIKMADSWFKKARYHLVALGFLAAFLVTPAITLTLPALGISLNLVEGPFFAIQFSHLPWLELIDLVDLAFVVPWVGIGSILIINSLVFSWLKWIIIGKSSRIAKLEEVISDIGIRAELEYDEALWAVWEKLIENKDKIKFTRTELKGLPRYGSGVSTLNLEKLIKCDQAGNIESIILPGKVVKNKKAFEAILIELGRHLWLLDNQGYKTLYRFSSERLWDAKVFTARRVKGYESNIRTLPLVTLYPLLLWISRIFLPFRALVSSVSFTRHFEALELKGERTEFNIEKELKQNPREDSRAVADVGVTNQQGEEVFEMAPKEITELIQALGISEGELGALIKKAFSALEKWGIDTSRVKDSKILIGLINEKDSKHLFEDHKENNFIGINRTLLNIARDNPRIAQALLIAGLAHELRHEAGIEGEDITLDAEFIVRNLMEINEGDPTKLNESLKKTYVIIGRFLKNVNLIYDLRSFENKVVVESRFSEVPPEEEISIELDGKIEVKPSENLGQDERKKAHEKVKEIQSQINQVLSRANSIVQKKSRLKNKQSRKYNQLQFEFYGLDDELSNLLDSFEKAYRRIFDSKQIAGIYTSTLLNVMVSYPLVVLNESSGQVEYAAIKESTKLLSELMIQSKTGRISVNIPYNYLIKKISQMSSPSVINRFLEGIPIVVDPFESYQALLEIQKMVPGDELSIEVLSLGGSVEPLLIMTRNSGPFTYSIFVDFADAHLHTHANENDPGPSFEDTEAAKKAAEDGTLSLILSLSTNYRPTLLWFDSRFNEWVEATEQQAIENKLREANILFSDKATIKKETINAEPLILEALGSDEQANASKRAIAIRALGEIENPSHKIIDTLFLLTERTYKACDFVVRSAAIEALANSAVKNPESYDKGKIISLFTDLIKDGLYLETRKFITDYFNRIGYSAPELTGLYRYGLDRAFRKNAPVCSEAELYFSELLDLNKTCLLDFQNGKLAKINNLKVNDYIKQNNLPGELQEKIINCRVFLEDGETLLDSKDLMLGAVGFADKQNRYDFRAAVILNDVFVERDGITYNLKGCLLLLRNGGRFVLERNSDLLSVHSKFNEMGINDLRKNFANSQKKKIHISQVSEEELEAYGFKLEDDGISISKIRPDAEWPDHWDTSGDFGANRVGAAQTFESQVLETAEEVWQDNLQKPLTTPAFVAQCTIRLRGEDYTAEQFIQVLSTLEGKLDRNEKPYLRYQSLWTPERLSEVLKLYKQGKSNIAITQELRLAKKTVNSMLIALREIEDSSHKEVDETLELVEGDLFQNIFHDIFDQIIKSDDFLQITWEHFQALVRKKFKELGARYKNSDYSSLMQKNRYRSRFLEKQNEIRTGIVLTKWRHFIAELGSSFDEFIENRIRPAGLFPVGTHTDTIDQFLSGIGITKTRLILERGLTEAAVKKGYDTDLKSLSKKKQDEILKIAFVTPQLEALLRKLNGHKDLLLGPLTNILSFSEADLAKRIARIEEYVKRRHLLGPRDKSIDEVRHEYNEIKKAILLLRKRTSHYEMPDFIPKLAELILFDKNNEIVLPDLMSQIGFGKDDNYIEVVGRLCGYVDQGGSKDAQEETRAYLRELIRSENPQLKEVAGICMVRTLLYLKPEVLEGQASPSGLIKQILLFKNRDGIEVERCLKYFMSEQYAPTYWYYTKSRFGNGDSLVDLTRRSAAFYLQALQSQGNLIGKLFRDREASDQVLEGISAKEQGGFLVLYDGLTDKFLYTKDGRLARVKLIEESFNTVSGEEVRIIEDNEHIRGFADSHAIYLTKSLHKNPIARFHEQREKYYAQNLTRLIQEGKLPKDINSHTLIRGCGKDVRRLVYDAIKNNKLSYRCSAEEVIDYLENNLSPERHNKAEFALIEFNQKLHRKGLDLIFGDQDFAFGYYINDMFSDVLRGKAVELEDGDFDNLFEKDENAKQILKGYEDVIVGSVDDVARGNKNRYRGQGIYFSEGATEENNNGLLSSIYIKDVVQLGDVLVCDNHYKEAILEFLASRRSKIQPQGNTLIRFDEHDDMHGDFRDFPVSPFMKLDELIDQMQRWDWFQEDAINNFILPALRSGFLTRVIRVHPNNERIQDPFIKRIMLRLSNGAIKIVSRISEVPDWSRDDYSIIAEYDMINLHENELAAKVRELGLKTEELIGSIDWDYCSDGKSDKNPLYDQRAANLIDFIRSLPFNFGAFSMATSPKFTNQEQAISWSRQLISKEIREKEGLPRKHAPIKAESMAKEKKIKLESYKGNRKLSEQDLEELKTLAASTGINADFVERIYNNNRKILVIARDAEKKIIGYSIGIKSTVKTIPSLEAYFENETPEYFKKEGDYSARPFRDNRWKSTFLGFAAGVDQSRRGHGIGEVLYRKMFEEVRQSGYQYTRIMNDFTDKQAFNIRARILRDYGIEDDITRKTWEELAVKDEDGIEHVFAIFPIFNAQEQKQRDEEYLRLRDTAKSTPEDPDYEELLIEREESQTLPAQPSLPFEDEAKAREEGGIESSPRSRPALIEGLKMRILENLELPYILDGELDSWVDSGNYEDVAGFLNGEETESESRDAMMNVVASFAYRASVDLLELVQSLKITPQEASEIESWLGKQSINVSLVVGKNKSIVKTLVDLDYVSDRIVREMSFTENVDPELIRVVNEFLPEEIRSNVLHRLLGVRFEPEQREFLEKFIKVMDHDEPIFFKGISFFINEVMTWPERYSQLERLKARELGYEHVFVEPAKDLRSSLEQMYQYNLERCLQIEGGKEALKEARKHAMPEELVGATATTGSDVFVRNNYYVTYLLDVYKTPLHRMAMSTIMDLNRTPLTDKDGNEYIIETSRDIVALAKQMAKHLYLVPVEGFEDEDSDNGNGGAQRLKGAMRFENIVSDVEHLNQTLKTSCWIIFLRNKNTNMRERGVFVFGGLDFMGNIWIDQINMRRLSGNGLGGAILGLIGENLNLQKLEIQVNAEVEEFASLFELARIITKRYDAQPEKYKDNLREDCEFLKKNLIRFKKFVKFADIPERKIVKDHLMKEMIDHIWNVVLASPLSKEDIQNTRWAKMCWRMGLKDVKMRAEMFGNRKFIALCGKTQPSTIAVGARQELYKGLARSAIVIDKAVTSAKGKVFYIYPDEVQIVQEIDQEARKRDLISSPVTDNSSGLGATLKDAVESDPNKDSILLAFSGDHGNFWHPNSAVLINGKLVAKEEGVRGIFQKEYTPLNGKFWLFCFDDDNKGLHQLEIKNGRLINPHNLQNGIFGPPLLINGDRIISKLKFFMRPPTESFHIPWPRGQRMAMSAIGYNQEGELVKVDLAGNPKAKVRKELTIDTLSEALKKLKVTDAILLGTSACVQTYDPFDTQTTYLVAQPREGSLTEDLFIKDEGRPLAHRIKILAKKTPSKKKSGVKQDSAFETRNSFKICFVCERNMERSVMAADLTEKSLPENLKGKVEIVSAGIKQPQGKEVEEMQGLLQRSVVSAQRRHIPLSLDSDPEMFLNADLYLIAEQGTLDKFKRKYPHLAERAFLILGDKSLHVNPETDYSKQGKTYEGLKKEIEGNIDNILSRINKAYEEKVDLDTRGESSSFHRRDGPGAARLKNTEHLDNPKKAYRKVVAVVLGFAIAFTFLSVIPTFMAAPHLVPLVVVFCLPLYRILFANIYTISSSLLHLVGKKEKKRIGLYSGESLPALAKEDLPSLTITIPVYKEPFYVIRKSLETALKEKLNYNTNAERELCNIVVCDDGLLVLADNNLDQFERGARAITESERTPEQKEVIERLDFYRKNNIAVIARAKPIEGKPLTERKGTFKKASNVNNFLRVARDIKDLSKNEDFTLQEAQAKVLTQEQNELCFVIGDLEIGSMMLLLDKDSEVPEGISVLTMPEFHSDKLLAYTQHMTIPSNYNENYMSKIIGYFTNLIYGVFFVIGARIGSGVPFVGHNAFLRTDLVYEQGLFREDRATEDISLQMDLAVKGYHGRYIDYDGYSFGEAVSSSFAEESGKFYRYLYGAGELIFNPVIEWFDKGILKEQTKDYLMSDKIPWFVKLDMFSYIFLLFSIALLPVILISAFLTFHAPGEYLMPILVFMVTGSAANFSSLLKAEKTVENKRYGSGWKILLETLRFAIAGSGLFLAYSMDAFLGGLRYVLGLKPDFPASPSGEELERKNVREALAEMRPTISRQTVFIGLLATVYILKTLFEISNGVMFIAYINLFLFMVTPYLANPVLMKAVGNFIKIELSWLGSFFNKVDSTEAGGEALDLDESAGAARLKDAGGLDVEEKIHSAEITDIGL